MILEPLTKIMPLGAMPSEISVKEVRKKEGMKTKEHLFHNLMLYPLTKFFPVLFAFTFSENAFKGKQSMRKFSLQINVFLQTN